MARLASSMRVIFVEEPVIEAGGPPELKLTTTDCGVIVAVPRFPHALDEAAAIEAQRELLDRLLGDDPGTDLVLWYYTPMAVPFSSHLRASAIVFDCMDELSAFKGAPPALRARERELFRRADLVFTGGHSLYEAKRQQHRAVYAFPSSVDIGHFAQARDMRRGAADQQAIPRPRAGFYGVIDERMDLDLIAAVADSRPDLQIVMVGPVVKIDPESLPRRPNIHWLGSKTYKELPAYLSGWDVALMPFAMNEATRFISPTKTPEYLAAGRPVVSTPIADVIRTYGGLDAVKIASTPAEFAEAIDACLEMSPEKWRGGADHLLSTMSWDATVERMQELIAETFEQRALARERRRPLKSAPTRSARRSGYDCLIVGAGFAGSVMAERLARDSGKRVLLIDRRPHIGGNAYDHYDNAGILVHRYGPHIFHTNSQQVFEYLSQFTQWRPYEHRVRAAVNGRLVPIPINLTTVNALYGLDLDGEGMAAFLARRAEPVAHVRTSEDVVIRSVGRELYELFFRGYTRKQWGIDPSDLDKAVTARIPTRTNTDDRYFSDTYQAMPLHGYTRMFENMLDHPNIKIMLNTDYREIARIVPHERLIYTGPVDEYFDFCYGPLPYRSLSFRHETLNSERFQDVAVVNYPSEDVGFTRITEYKHLTGQEHARTSISYEFPCAEGDPYYPVPRPENAALYKRYQALADRTPGVSFVGRLATYKYYNMDQVVGQALALYTRLRAAASASQDSEGAIVAAGD
jgi:UDP-galactopyranose mutase